MRIITANDLQYYANKIKSGTETYPKETAIDILYNGLKPIYEYQKDDILDSSKYVRLARRFKYPNYRLCRFSDIIRLGLESSLPSYECKFIRRQGAVLIIFNTLNDKPISMVYRSLSEKIFMDSSLFYTMYGYDMISSDFKYGDYLLLTEGYYDADSIREVYKNSLAMQTSNITLIQSKILQTLTDKFIIAFDADKAGNNGFEKAMDRLYNGVNIVKKMPIYHGDKDLGMLQEYYDIDTKEYTNRKLFYEKVLKYLIQNEYSIDI